MFLAFIAANVILWIALATTTTFAALLQQILMDMIGWQWLSVTLAGGIIGIVIGYLCDWLIAVLSPALPQPITNGVFALASMIVVGLALLAATDTHIPHFDEPQANLLVWLCIGAMIWCAVEMWPLLGGVPGPGRLPLAFGLGMAVFSAAFLLPVYVFGQFVDNYNAGLAAYMAAWVAALAARPLKRIFGSRSIEAPAVEEAVKAFVQRDLPVVLATAVAYAIARSAGNNLILFSVLTGVVVPVVLGGLAGLLPD